MDEELRALQAQLAAVQEQDTVHKLSQRNCVEIVLKLIDDRQVELIFSVDGKEYITPSHLRVEIRELVVANGGRVSVVDLQPLLGVDVKLVHEAVREIVAADDDLRLVNDEIISEYYLDSVMEEANELLQDAGQLAVTQIAQQFALPVDLANKAVTSRVGSIFQGHLKDGQLYTNAFVQHHNARLRGIFSAVETPTPLRTLIAKYDLMGELVHGEVSRLIAAGSLYGELHGSNDRATFVPTVYKANQEAGVLTFFRQNRYIEYSALKSLEVSQPKRWIKARFQTDTYTNKGNKLSPSGGSVAASKPPTKSSVVLLKTCAVDTVLLEGVMGSIEEAGSEESWCGIRQFLPGALTEEDAVEVLRILLLRYNEESGSRRRRRRSSHRSGDTELAENQPVLQMGGVYAVSEGFVNQCSQVLGPFVRDLAAKHSAAAAASAQPGDNAADGGDDDDDDDAGQDGGHTNSRSTRKGKKGRRKKNNNNDDGDDDNDNASSGSKKQQRQQKKKKKRKGRRGRRDDSDDDWDDVDEDAIVDMGPSSKKARRKAARGGSKGSNRRRGRKNNDSDDDDDFGGNNQSNNSNSRKKKEKRAEEVVTLRVLVGWLSDHWPGHERAENEGLEEPPRVVLREIAVKLLPSLLQIYKDALQSAVTGGASDRRKQHDAMAESMQELYDHLIMFYRSSIQLLSPPERRAHEAALAGDSDNDDGGDDGDDDDTQSSSRRNKRGKGSRSGGGRRGDKQGKRDKKSSSSAATGDSGEVDDDTLAARQLEEEIAKYANDARFDAEAVRQLHKHLLKTLGAKLLDLLLQHEVEQRDIRMSEPFLSSPSNTRGRSNSRPATPRASETFQPRAYTPDQRQEILAKLPPNVKKPLRALVSAFTAAKGTSVVTFLPAFDAAASACEFYLKKPDRKKERQVAFAFRRGLIQQVEEDDGLDLMRDAVLLQSVTLILHSSATNTFLHAPSRTVPKIVRTLKSLLKPEAYEALQAYCDQTMDLVAFDKQSAAAAKSGSHCEDAKEADSDDDADDDDADRHDGDGSDGFEVIEKEREDKVAELLKHRPMIRKLAVRAKSYLA